MAETLREQIGRELFWIDWDEESGYAYSRSTNGDWDEQDEYLHNHYISRAQSIFIIFLQSLKNIKPLGDEEIDKIIGKQLHKDGVYIAETLDITLTIFQLLAIIQASRKDYERQLKEMIG